MEAGPPPESRETKLKRVSSPSAANRVAGCRTLARAGKISGEVLQLTAPALVVLPVSLAPPGVRDPVEARLRDREPSPLGKLLQLEDHQCHRLRRIHIRIAAGLPTPGEEVLRLHPLHDDLE